MKKETLYKGLKIVYENGDHEIVIFKKPLDRDQAARVLGKYYYVRIAWFIK